jgi:hypothetical protein
MDAMDSRQWLRERMLDIDATCWQREERVVVREVANLAGCRTS